MAKSETYFQKRLHKLTDFDSIRKLKILEIFQYNFFGFILVTIFATSNFLRKHIFTFWINAIIKTIRILDLLHYALL